MRFVFASHRYHPVPGGTERMVGALAEGLVRRGHQATVVTRAEPGLPSEDSHAGVTIRRIPTRRVGGVSVPQHYIRLLRGLDADLFHMHGNRIWCADFYFPWARTFRWRQVLTGHNFYQYSLNPTRLDRFYFERYFPRVVRAFDAYAAHVTSERDRMVSWGYPADRIRVIPSGYQAQEFERPPLDPGTLRSGWGLATPHIAVYAGGLFENKRVDRLVEAVASTRGSWGLVVIGRDVPGSRYDLAYCQALATRLGAPVRFLGQLPRPDTVTALLASDAVVLGSEYEGFGLLLLEALGAGRPFVSWATGVAPELARDTHAGEAVTSVADFGAALTRLDDPEVFAGRVAASRRAAPMFTDERLVDRYFEMYRSVLGAG